MISFRNIRLAAAILIVALGVISLPARPASASDFNITTDPLAAVIMPKAEMGAATFRPSFIVPTRRIDTFELPLEVQTPDRFPTPGLASRTPQRPVNVSVTVPPSNSIFPPKSIVTLGWLPAEQEISDGDAPNKVQFPIRYEIYISRHDIWTARLFVKAQDTKREYTYLFTPPGPGRYTWHVRAVYNKAMHGHNSDQRTFMVLP